MSDERTNVGPDSAPPAGKRPGLARGTAFKAAALLLATLCLVIGAACWFAAPPHDGNQADNPPSGGQADDDLFFNWGKPLFVVVLSAQQHGYLQPCGCSDPQYGGLERRYNFIKSLRDDRKWPVVAYDLGDIAQKEGPAKLANVQGLIKYRYAMQAMKSIGYIAVSFGEYEAALALNGAMDEYALNDDKPAVLAANLLNKNVHFPDKDRKGPEWDKSYVGSWQVTQATPDVKVGALGIIGTHDMKTIAGLMAKGILPAGVSLPPSVGSQITALDKKFDFAPAHTAIKAELKAMAAKKPDFRVLLYQGPVELAKLIPQVNPEFNVILCLGKEDEPPGRPERVTTPNGETFVIRVGHKGKNIGVVGVFPPKIAGGPYELKYQLVPMAPHYQTPKEKVKGQPILALLERYHKELKDDNYLARYGKVPHSVQAAVKGMPAVAGLPSGYAGSETCQKCHPNAFKIWQGTKHSQAHATLVGAKNPSLSEFNPECIVCHTVGFRYQGGFADATATPNLKDVGCESCHGPCEVHTKRPRDKNVRALINPWKAPLGETPADKTKRLLRIEGMCRDCHDAENDVHWKALAPKWAQIDHPTPRDEQREGDE